MLKFMAFCFCLSLVLLLSAGGAGAAVVAFLVMLATPVVWFVWLLTAPSPQQRP